MLDMIAEQSLARLDYWRRQHEGARSTLLYLRRVEESKISNWPALVARVEAKHGISLRRMRGHHGRQRPVIHAQQELAWLLLHHGHRCGQPIGYDFIAPLLDRARTSVLRSVQQYERRQGRRQ